MRLISLVLVIASVAATTAFAKSTPDEPAKPKSENQKTLLAKAIVPAHKQPASETKEQTSLDNVQGLKPGDRRYRIFD